MKAKNRIKIVLAELEIKSKFLVEELDVSKTTVSRWVNNKQQPTLEHLYSMAEKLEVRVCSLLVQNEPKDEETETSE